MTFTAEFIDVAIIDHKRWLDKVMQIAKELEIPMSWRHDIISHDCELNNLLTHLKIEIHDEFSIYHDIKYELSYVKTLMVRSLDHVKIICLLIDLNNRSQFSTQLRTAIVDVIEIVKNDIMHASTDILSRLQSWKDKSI